MSLRQQELSLDTPAVVIDTAQVKRNIDAFQTYCDEHGMAVRPHIKTHKLPQFAHWQLEAGAVGITCQKISEAEVMADAGIEDILITYNILGAIKLQRLRYLSQKLSKLAVVADNSTVVEGLAKAFEDSNGLLNDAEGYHRSLAIAMNPDKFAQFFFEQGKSQATEDVIRKTKNINMSERRTPEVSTKGGMQIKSLSQPSSKGLKIKSIKRT